VVVSVLQAVGFLLFCWTGKNSTGGVLKESYSWYTRISFATIRSSRMIILRGICHF